MDSMGPMPTSLSQFPPEYVDYNVGPAVIATSIAMTVATVLLVAIRFIIRSRSAMGLGKDDWMILAVVVSDGMVGDGKRLSQRTNIPPE